jgi:thiamine-monophosphate kinase
MLDIFMLGEVEKGKALLRSGAKPGDYICCTGQLGDSAAGLALLQRKAAAGGAAQGAVLASAKALLLKRHRLPVPRVLAGRYLLKEKAATACIDVSDGLASELRHLADESGVGMDIDAAAVPLSASALLAAKALKTRALDWALNGGEDYELLFTVRPSKMKLLAYQFGRMTGASFHVLGKVRRGRGVRMKSGKRWKLLNQGGYEHAIF